LDFYYAKASDLDQLGFKIWVYTFYNPEFQHISKEIIMDKLCVKKEKKIQINVKDSDNATYEFLIKI
jgi:hypothetical protein